MNKFLSWIFKDRLKISKYFIFSFIFVLSLFLGLGEGVKGAQTTASTPTSTISDFTGNNKNVGTVTTAGTNLTPIDGSLSSTCISAPDSTFLGYTITSSNHKGNNSDSSYNCVSYVKGTDQYFYLQADSSHKTITFTVTADDDYNYIAVFERGYSLSNLTGYDYDLYTFDGSNYTGSRIRFESADFNGSISPIGNHEFTFTYTLRDFHYGDNEILVYFYTAYPDTTNETKMAQLSFILAKPINEYDFVVATDSTVDSVCAAGKICLIYNPYSLDSGTHTGTNNITIKIPDSNAALYFSTVNTHIGVAINTDTVARYNSIYATNTFSNEGGGDTIVYSYFNLKDFSVYDAEAGISTTSVTSPASPVMLNNGYYKFVLTIDASGKYEFYLTDIFQNRKISDSAQATDYLVVNDISNRDLDIFFISYSLSDGTTYADYGKTYDGRTFAVYELTANLSDLTNNNVTIGLEFYYKINIDETYAVNKDASDALPNVAYSEIKSNPLYRESNDNNPLTNQIFIDHNDPANGTYFCRRAVADTAGCVSNSSNSVFGLRKLAGLNASNASDPQYFAANAITGKKEINNVFAYNQGILVHDNHFSSPDVIGNYSSTQRYNNVHFQVNENGQYYVYLKDIYGNTKNAVINVTIIDQIKPIITLGGSNNVICTSMYVIGGGWNNDTVATNKSAYPENLLQSSDCATSIALYNQFVEVAADSDTEKQGTVSGGIRANYILVRNTLTPTKENGFYTTDNLVAVFNYADAIRMALLRVSDSIQFYSTGADSLMEKSVYETNNSTYTAYKLKSLNYADPKVLVDLGDSSNSSSTLGTRVNYESSRILSNNILQYSSELESYVTCDGANSFADCQFVTFQIIAIDASGNSSAVVCSSPSDDNCYDIVNEYIDKGISFKIKFNAVDYVGNISNDVEITITVVDDTTPGIGKLDDTTGAVQSDPIIAMNNIDSVCRLEVGNIIQNRKALMECYGFITDRNSGTPGDYRYNFVDNATNYEFMNNTSVVTSPISSYFTNVTYNQLYNVRSNYDSHIAVYICKISGNNQCDGSTGKEWLLIDDNTSDDATPIKFTNAGNYEIKFVISDQSTDYRNNSKTANTTTIILCYYINPRVLLVTPIQSEKQYGTPNAAGDYCVYATTYTAAFFENLFKKSDGDRVTYLNTYYENSTNGIVYCTNMTINGVTYNVGQTHPQTHAKFVSLETILANSAADIRISGSLSRTYATGTNANKLELTTASTYNAYEDVGYYWITMGDLRIASNDSGLTAAEQNSKYKQNYVLRLHPSYLPDGDKPNEALTNYMDLVHLEANDNHYKYGVNTEAHGETISNVVYTIYQAPLAVSANAGSKIYGNPDTNYGNVLTTGAATSISAITSITSIADHTATATNNISTSGYLNGLSVSGLINDVTTTSGNYLSDYNSNKYVDILSGFARREAGEKVGSYNICISLGADVVNSWNHNDCSFTISNRISVATVTLTTGNEGNVYIDKLATNHVTGDVSYGNYIKTTDNRIYRITVNNSNLTVFYDYFNSNGTIWRYDYDDTNYTFAVLVNDTNGNQNYYINYTSAQYTINPRTLIVQPGINQGKEYSNPTHNDPTFEIVMYGENLSVTASEPANNAAFNGYTESITHTITDSPASYDSYGAGTYTVADTEVYFSDRRKKTSDLELSNTITYEYVFERISIVDDQFTLDGNTYNVSGTSICLLPTNASDKCITSGGYIGVNKLTIDGSEIIVSWDGVRKYQNYELFTTAGGSAGSGYITRQNGTVDTAEAQLNEGRNVGWYSYVFEHSHLHAITNGKNQCVVNTTTYTYTVNNATGSDACSNYEVQFIDKAPYSSNGLDFITYQSSSLISGYKPNGVNFCSDTSVYSFACGATETTITNIKFEVFKRDIIISFNAADHVYGQLYPFYFGTTGSTYHIESSLTNLTAASPLTCYRKRVATDTLSNYVTGGNGIQYVAISISDCNSVDYGLSSSDKWGIADYSSLDTVSNTVLNLRFSLNSVIINNFSTTYPIPAGTYFVEAMIGNSSGVHPNYNLVYIDYDKIWAEKDKDGNSVNTGNPNPDVQKDGTLRITPRPVDLIGTYYQKEFGQALYTTYNINGSALTATNTLSGIASYTLANSRTTSVKIFDNHYYYCLATNVTVNEGVSGYAQSVAMGCAAEFYTGLTAEQVDKYKYDEIGNVYLYTVSAVLGITDSGIATTGSYLDEIFVNFAGRPVREAPANHTTNDNYGLLDDVGFYEIDLNGISAVVAQYNGVTFNKANGTLFRDTNYSINSTTSGGLYITPAKIEVQVVNNQTKMYGCAYNNINVDAPSYTYSNGYSNCVETVKQYYDLGYKYLVKGDKTNYLKNSHDGFDLTDDTLFGVSLVTNRKDPSASDITYSDSIGDTLSNYWVVPNYADGLASENGLPSYTALNGGTLYRIPMNIESAATSTTANLDDLFSAANDAQATVANAIFQKQSVGQYVVTIGNLDASFNSNVHCDGYSTVLSASPTSKCKNFVVHYGNSTTTGDNNTLFNTATHHTTGDGTVEHPFEDAFDSSLKQFTFVNSSLTFTITNRNIVLTTEYNYKVFGDTDPNEGFTCLDLKNMFTYPGTYGTAGVYRLTGLFGYDNTTNAYSGRSYCSGGDDAFISTGVARFYAIDNSLAKAPWTSWNDQTTEMYKAYNDTLFDVIDINDSKRVTRNIFNTGIDDPVGTYAYDLSAVATRTGLSGANYTIHYLVVTGDDPELVIGSSALNASNPTMGFARDATEPLNLWYTDNNHLCLGGVVVADECTGTNYNPTGIYKFHISTLEYNNANSYKVTTGVTYAVSNLISNVYFEIVRREIIIKTLDVTKDYGNEDKYSDFNVELCSEINPSDGTCTPIELADHWGARKALSQTDYDTFFPLATPRVFSQSAFKGGNTDDLFKGSTTSGAFGIHFYRTYGETIGTYVIVACPTQVTNDSQCVSYYENTTRFANDEARLLNRWTEAVIDATSFIVDSPTSSYNASNYIIKTVPAEIQINRRKIFINPDENQGFMYGNYENGMIIPPITFTETYKPDTTELGEGLVNGKLGKTAVATDVNDDTINKQYALCIFDIAEKLTCINDRQNTGNNNYSQGQAALDNTVIYVTSGMHPTKGYTLTTPTVERYLSFNVFNDDYKADNKPNDDRYALNRSIGTDTDARYYREVGTYTITAGELLNDHTCGLVDSLGLHACINNNYEVVGVKAGVQYVITPATIIVTPRASQNKTYGESDVEIKFDVVTKFGYDYPAVDADLYYCDASHCQLSNNYETVFGVGSYDTGIITLTSYAYGENIGTDGYNYGLIKNKNKSSTSSALSTTLTGIPKYYDKYCLGAANPETCSVYDGSSASSKAARLTYEGNSSTRILLGYFYVDKWTQRVGTYDIRSGIEIASNPYGNKNYLYKTSYDAVSEIVIDDDTGIDFTINKLAIKAIIPTVEKIYGQATDSHKCDAVSASNVDLTYIYKCNEDYATLSANDNEGRLEYNFNIQVTAGTDKDVTEGVGKVLMVEAISNNYYTQTALPEYKNIHLGLTVVRKINQDTAGFTCIQSDDKYGCEDAGTYVLAFRHQAVPNNVDDNYLISVGSSNIITVGDHISATTVQGYAIVESSSVVFNQTDGDEFGASPANNSGTVTYIIYHSDTAPTFTIDTIPSGQSSGNNDATNSNGIYLVVGGDYTSTLTIHKREVTFYVGTYNSDGSVADRYVIEQNEQVPEIPRLNTPFTTSKQAVANAVRSKDTHFVTWFDDDEYLNSTHSNTPRQVRTNDALQTTQTETKGSFGILLCKNSYDDVRRVKYSNPEELSYQCTNTVTYSEANDIDSGSYKFDTSNVGDYPILRDKSVTYIGISAANEDRNYSVTDINGVLVVYQDSTAPVIEIGTSVFTIEANAHVSPGSCSTNPSDDAFEYNCSLVGLTFDEDNKVLGDIIKYLAEHYSDYGNTSGTSRKTIAVSNDNKNYKLPASLNDLIGYAATNSAANDANINAWGVAATATLSSSAGTYYPVNNIGINSDTTLYTRLRNADNYAFGSTDSANANYERVISNNLEAISSIISWFNINSFDFSYIRGSEYLAKRYTPRYNIFIEHNATLSAFDPTYVGDFTITISAIDDVGNISVAATVTLKIIDTTIPETGEMHLFNTQVECSEVVCSTNTIDSWTVTAGYVSIDHFTKYDASGYEDNVNGTYIKLNGVLMCLYPNKTCNSTTAIKPVVRYNAAGTEDVLGNYVRVNANLTPAIEVEHKYWSNTSTKYLVVVGGKDNSYIDASSDDSLSQWNTYFTIDSGTTWYKYARHGNTGLEISFADGISEIFTRVLDSGRSMSRTITNNGWTYYNNVYLRYVDGDACSSPAPENCAAAIIDSLSSTDITRATATIDEVTGTFKIHSITITYDSANSQVNWDGLSAPRSVVSGQFNFGIMTCTISGLNVTCESSYKFIYKSGTSDRVTKKLVAYTVSDLPNLGDWDDTVEAPDTPDRFYNDRRYIFIDTAVPVISALNGQGFSIYEYDTSCTRTSPSTDAICSATYIEKFLRASDGIDASKSTSSITDASNPSAVNLDDLTTITSAQYTNIVRFTGSGFVLNESENSASGLIVDSATTDITTGATTFGTNVGDYVVSDDVSHAMFNKNKLQMIVYISVDGVDIEAASYRYVIIYNGERYIAIMQTYDGESFGTVSLDDESAITKLANNEGPGVITIEDILELLVGTNSVSGASGANLTFSVNYVIKDAAGNASVPQANLSVRGVMFTKITSKITARFVSEDIDDNHEDPNEGVALTQTGNNSYSITINQGVSLSSIISGLTISNINNEGVNNLSTIKQSLYYNNKAIFEGLPMSANLVELMQDYTNSPGVYTLRLTSTRTVNSNGRAIEVEDEPFELEFIVKPNNPLVDVSGNYTRNIAIIASLVFIFAAMIVVTTVVVKKRKED